jgi:hypothetical protein
MLKQAGKLQLYNKLQRKLAKAITEKERLFINTAKRDYFCRPVKCPECGQLMANLGLDFKAPTQNDVKQWRIIESLYTTGHSFYTCGCNGPGFIPKDKTQHREYLADRLKEYTGFLTAAQNDFDRRFQKSERTKYWDDKIKLVESEIAKIK